MASSKKGQSTATTAMEVGAGLAAVAAAAGATYWFYADKDAKKHRKSASTWAKGMKQQVVKEAKKLKNVDQKTMAAIVDRAASMYSTARSVDANDLKAAARELKKNWKKVADDARGVKGKVVGAAKSAKRAVSKAKTSAKKSSSTAKKAVKKTGKKVTK